jgi:hypothetical protein
VEHMEEDTSDCKVLVRNLEGRGRRLGRQTQTCKGGECNVDGSTGRAHGGVRVRVRLWLTGAQKLQHSGFLFG